MKNKILGVIPARGGSKGIPKKNLHSLNGKPLITYSIEAGQKSEMLTDLIVSTDCNEIKEISEHYGANVPFIRPKRFAHDRALAIPTIQYAVETYEVVVGHGYDYIIMLQPTAPLRSTEDIDNSLKELIDQKADSIISVIDVDNYHPMKMKIVRNNLLFDFQEPPTENPPRQSLPKVFIVNGAIYATKRGILMNNSSFKGVKCLPYFMPMERSINIDNEIDFIVAEYYLKGKHVDESKNHP